MIYGLILGVTGTLLLLSLAIWILYNTNYKPSVKERQTRIKEIENKISMFKSATESEERERERIARNLHDEVNLMLAVHKQILEKHADNFENGEFNIEEYYKEIQNIERISEAVNACATNLVPAFLLKNGLINTLEDHIRQINHSEVLNARFEFSDSNSEVYGLSKTDELHIYRVCLELINNIRKHTQATQLTMKVSLTKKNLVIQLRHNGKRITNEEIELKIKETGGLGLKSIQARNVILKSNINYLYDDTSPFIVLVVPNGKLSAGRKFIKQRKKKVPYGR